MVIKLREWEKGRGMGRKGRGWGKRRGMGKKGGEWGLEDEIRS